MPSLAPEALPKGALTDLGEKRDAVSQHQPVIKTGKSVRDKLAKLGIHDIFGLLLHLPLRYQDETHLYPIADAPVGQVAQVEGSVTHASVTYKPRKMLTVKMQDGSGALQLRFLHFYPSQAASLIPGVTLRVLGELRHGFLGAEMVHPQYRIVKENAPLAEALTPVYPTTQGLSQGTLRKLIGQALAEADLCDTLPDALRTPLHLPDFASSLTLLHQPPPDIAPAALDERKHPAWQRVIFDELLAQQLSMRLHYQKRRARGAPPLPPRHQLGAALLARLPFPLTSAQQRVCTEISADLARAHPMQRLLQGDVGSGKTVVAALAACQAIENGFQAAIMAPTEILAEQHYLKLSAWLEPLGITLAWLSGSLGKKDKRAALERVSSGEAQLAIGTHALFQEQVEFRQLGLAIIDEQHRFGVHQRLALRQKGGEIHQLMMSATPIPRTLSMSYYADLDVSVIDQLPPGRTPIVTKLVDSARRDEVIARIRDACVHGRQAYWVCPLIEESEDLQLKTALETFELLSQTFPELSIGLVHGRQPAAVKAATMARFKAGEIQLLVATTVIEVGVDVSNASLMVIEHAERFGLSQLHQLRGRVGRGAARSTCILLFQSPLSESARARLRIIYENNDGFEVARQDLALRGPGEFLGARQSGVPMLRFADLERDQRLLEAARHAAERMLADFPDLAERHLERWLGQQQDMLKA
ncbi:MAG: ATP-dependent DNA helicase RecG [Sulfurimicrobium sp.]|nr:ATP-dependent DNA helicase RecG [Sulfurimicrobium sp.]MDP1703942.1 ATP-dependent DNA helicase RecG [Sulfurimicrobium sp.]MDP2198163.1 ATP-dependent DNA helicase RecG [Sulfurimicrobium sp.]MDP2962663.1 ATP-dependent DNA helicase RecG [Sulfurimicrobium sp.]MDP3688825.1 ATP-dependent DNA helicase RecG [Sulfurimicrobium sp.]